MKLAHHNSGILSGNGCDLLAVHTSHRFHKIHCLARKGIQITQTALSKLEKRGRYVMDYELVAIAECLKVSLDWLCEREEKAR